MEYREDIDGLRAIAVLSVVLFHLGYLPNGYLGVDIFFVISGFLITTILYKKASTGNVDILEFYVRRIRRIVPLLLFTTTAALMLGYFVMLPDDLDSLGQAVFASNFSANNILMYITSSDYWAARNDYKPLMHTWSLGVEEQFYLFFPFLFLAFRGLKVRWIGISLLLFTITSFFLFATTSDAALKFYWLPHRFFEFTLGGLAALWLYGRKLPFGVSQQNLFILGFAGMFAILFWPVPGHNDIKIVGVNLCAILLLTQGQSISKVSLAGGLMLHPLTVLLGKMSFSIYMIHQVVLAFARYMFVEQMTIAWAAGLILLTIAISYFTYHYVENPFRDKNRVSGRALAFILVPVFFISSFSGLYVYASGGILKDYPAMDVYKAAYKYERKLFRVSTNIHIQYNEDVRKLDRPFDDDGKINLLVIGNSFGRDVTNIWLESELAGQLQIRFFDMARALTDTTLRSRVDGADIVVIAEYGNINKEWLKKVQGKQDLDLDWDRVWAFGIKDYGNHNGVHYMRLGNITDFTTYTTKIKDTVVNRNYSSGKVWGEKYVDMLAPVMVRPGEVLVFTPEGKFISPDTGHLTRAGARFYAERLLNDMKKIIQSDDSRYMPSARYGNDICFAIFVDICLRRYIWL